MKRTTHSTRQLDLFGTGIDGFTDGVPSVHPATVLESTVMNSVVEEIARLITASGTSLNAADYAQLSQVAIGRREIDALLNCPQLADIDSAGGHTWRAAACNNLGRVVVVGTGGKIRTMDDFSGSWTSRTAGSSYSGQFNDIVWTGSSFVAVGNSGEVQTSPDGTTWTRRANSIGDIAAIAVYSGTLILVAAALTAQRSTDDGVTWANIASLTSTCYYVAANNGTWVAAEGGGGVREVWRSTDGSTFSVVDLSGLLSTDERVIEVRARGLGLGFVAQVLDTGDSTTKIIGSPDGLTWTVAVDVPSTNSRTLCAGRAGCLLLQNTDTTAIPAYVSYDAHTANVLYPPHHGGALQRVQLLRMDNTGFWILLGTSGQAGYVAVSPLLAP